MKEEIEKLIEKYQAQKIGAFKNWQIIKNKNAKCEFNSEYRTLAKVITDLRELLNKQ